jgi:hypothetical protein
MRITKTELNLTANKKLTPKRKKRLSLAIDFFKQNKINPQTKQLISKKRFETNICRAEDIN